MRVLGECPVRELGECWVSVCLPVRVLGECPVRVLGERVSSESVLRECPVRVLGECVLQ